MFYKNRMAGNKERAKAADRKLVAENEHLLPRVRGSEKVAMEVEVPLELELEAIEVPAMKEKRERKVKQKIRVDGGVEDEMDVN